MRKMSSKEQKILKNKRLSSVNSLFNFVNEILYEFIFCTYKVKTYHTLSWFNFVQAFKFMNSYFANISSTLVETPAKENPEETIAKLQQNRASEKRKVVLIFESNVYTITNIVVNLIKVGDKATHYHFKPWRLLTDLVRTSEPIWSYATGTLTPSKGQYNA